MKSVNKRFTISYGVPLLVLLLLIAAIAGCNSNGAGETEPPSDDADIPILSVSVTINPPETGGTPDLEPDWTGNFACEDVEWTPEDNPFKALTEYTVTMTFTANAGNTFTGLAAAEINGEEAEITANTGASLTITYTFSETQAEEEEEEEPISGGTGTKDDPYLIGTAERLAELAAAVNAGTEPSGKYYKLTRDIDLNIEPWKSGSGWMPIGNISATFMGSFNGNNHIIKNLYIDTPSVNSVGLFGYVFAARIENLSVTNVDVKGYYNTGGIAGNASSSIIVNCHSSGSINAYNGAGGIAGGINYTTITNCHFSSDGTTGIVSTGNNAGGIAGYVNTNCTITRCSAAGTVSGNGTCNGGVAGYLNNKCGISNCYATVNINGYATCGGIAGSVIDSSVSNCYATGNVTATFSGGTGGIAGSIDVNSSLNNCVALNANITAPGISYSGRVAGINNGTLTGNLALNTMLINDAAVSDGGINGTGISEANAKAKATYVDWDFDDIWTIIEGEGYPAFK